MFFLIFRSRHVDRRAAMNRQINTLKFSCFCLTCLHSCHVDRRAAMNRQINSLKFSCFCLTCLHSCHVDRRAAMNRSRFWVTGTGSCMWICILWFYILWSLFINILFFQYYPIRSYLTLSYLILSYLICEAVLLQCKNWRIAVGTAVWLVAFCFLQLKLFAIFLIMKLWGK